MKKSVFAEALQQSLKETLERYPLFQSGLKRGLFWYFLEEHFHPAIIHPIENFEPCRYERLKSTKKPLWRVFAGGEKIALEVSHILTDGVGAMEFFKTLLCRYYELAYAPLANWMTIKKTTDTPRESEMEYSYKKHRVPNPLKPRRTLPSFQYPEARGHTYRVTHMIINAADLKRAAANMGVGVTVFLTGVHFYTVQQLYCDMFGTRKNRKKAVVRELVLVNLRPFFESETLRNFYLFVMLDMDFSLGYYDLDEIVRKVQGQMQDRLDERKLRRDFSHYVELERNVFNRAIPWFVKNLVMRVAQCFSGEKKMIGSVSNMGVLNVPPPVGHAIRHAFFCPPPSRLMGRNISIIGHGEHITLTTGRYILNDNVERRMTQTLLAQNIDVLYLESKE